MNSAKHHTKDRSSRDNYTTSVNTTMLLSEGNRIVSASWLKNMVIHHPLYHWRLAGTWFWTNRLQKTFTQRSPHKRGTTSALRLLLGIPLGEDHESEFLQTQTQRCHIFDACACVNYLLCSALKKEERRRAKATKVMLNNSQQNFRKAMEILEPTVVVVQSKGYRDWVRRAFDQVTQLTDEFYQARLKESEVLIAVFAHPSTPDNTNNWGRSADTPYLINTVAPTLKKVRELIFE